MGSQRLDQLAEAAGLDGSELLYVFKDGTDRHIKSDTYQLFDIIDVTPDPNQDPATNDTRISDALAKADAGRPTLIRIRCNPDVLGDVPVSSLISITKASHWLVAEAYGSQGAGVRLRWEGASITSPIVTVDAPRAGLANMVVDANGQPACVQYSSHEDQGYNNLTCVRFTGDGLTVGDGVANNNRFRGKGVLNLQGMAGSRPLYTNAAATEDIHLETVLINEHADATAAMARAWFNDDGNTTIDDLTISGRFDIGDYAVRVRAGSIRVWNWTSEVGMPITFDAVGRARGCAILIADMRSCSPATGKYAIEHKGSGTSEATQTLLLGGVRIQTADGATVAPDVYADNSVVMATGVTFDVATAGDPLGSFQPAGNAEVAHVNEDGLDLHNFPVRSVDGSGNLTNMLRALPSSDQMRVGSTAWDSIYTLVASLHRLYLGTNVAVEVSEPADGDTALLLRRNVGGTLTLEQVSMGAADSGGTGFKVLRVPN